MKKGIIGGLTLVAIVLALVSGVFILQEKV